MTPIHTLWGAFLMPPSPHVIFVWLSCHVGVLQMLDGCPYVATVFGPIARCGRGVMLVCWLQVFSDRSHVNYVTTIAPPEHALVLELSVPGSSVKPRFASWFPASLGLSAPPPRHHWSTALPSEVPLSHIHTTCC